MEEVEAMSILEGIRLTVEKKWHNVVVDTDEMTDINHIRGNGFIWRIQTITDNLKALASSIRSMSWEAILRSAHKCADWIAKQAKSGVCPTDWVSRPPPTLCHFVLSDCNCN